MFILILTAIQYLFGQIRLLYTHHLSLYTVLPVTCFQYNLAFFLILSIEKTQNELKQGTRRKDFLYIPYLTASVKEVK